MNVLPKRRRPVKLGEGLEHARENAIDIRMS